MTTWVVFLLIAVAPGTIEVKAIPAQTERECRAVAAVHVEQSARGQKLPGGSVVIDAQCEGGA